MMTKNDAVTVSFRVPRPMLEKFLIAAESVGSVDRQGRNAGRGSVGAVVFDVAVGRLKLSLGGEKVAAASKKAQDSERKKFKFWPDSPPQWWRDEGLESGIMDLAVVLKKTGWTREELVADGWKCTDLVARAPWPCWGPRVPAWWVDSDEMEGMLVESVPGGLEAVAATGMTVVGGMVMPPMNGPAEQPKVAKGKKGGRK